jgi:hypothetical protein
MASSFWDRLMKALGPPPAESADPVPEAAPAPSPSIDPRDERIPDVTRPKLFQILGMIDETETLAQRHAKFAQYVAEVRQMRDQHLPKLITSYIDIPAQHRAEIFRRTGKSASFVLNEALDRIIKRLDEMGQSIASDDIDTFTQNLGFIEYRYGDNPFS